jgi:hypothetical protein
MPRGSAKLSVSGGLKAKFLLESDGVANRTVLRLSKGVGVRPSFREIPSGFKQLWWAKKTTDVVGAKWWG